MTLYVVRAARINHRGTRFHSAAHLARMEHLPVDAAEKWMGLHSSVAMRPRTQTLLRFLLEEGPYQGFGVRA